VIADADALTSWAHDDSIDGLADVPHSHHWQVMAGVRAAEHEAATINVGGADIMMAMTSIGDGVFPIHVDLEASGGPIAVRITIPV
jgi:predicted enzyme related to lactoylglutathione lyase